MLNRKPRSCCWALVLLVIAWCPGLRAYTVPWHQDSDVVGRNEALVVRHGDNLVDLARTLDTGQHALKAANPGVNWQHLQAGTVLVVPKQYLLPTPRRQGIVINLAERRLYYFHRDTQQVSIYPVAVGGVGWYTPTGMFKIIEKEHFPVWIVPDSVRTRAASNGVLLPKLMYPGPGNPLGEYALRLSHPRYLIHGTNDPDNVGLRVTAGCLRMYPKDIKELFSMVGEREPVQIVDIPHKFGWSVNRLYYESHVSMLPKNMAQEKVMAQKQLTLAIGAKRGVSVNHQRVQQFTQYTIGTPSPVGVRHRVPSVDAPDVSAPKRGV